MSYRVVLPSFPFGRLMRWLQNYSGICTFSFADCGRCSWRWGTGWMLISWPWFSGLSSLEEIQHKWVSMPLRYYGFEREQWLTFMTFSRCKVGKFSDLWLKRAVLGSLLYIPYTKLTLMGATFNKVCIAGLGAIVRDHTGSVIGAMAERI